MTIDKQTHSYRNTNTRNKIAMELYTNRIIPWHSLWSLHFIWPMDFFTYPKYILFAILIIKSFTIWASSTSVFLYWWKLKFMPSIWRICQRKIERKILHVSRDRMTNEGVRRKTGTIDAAPRAPQLKWIWGGHVVRMHHLRWTQMWDPRIGRRTAGRPKMRWADDFKKTAGTQWSTQTRRRATWKALEREATQALWTKSVHHRSQCQIVSVSRCN